MMILSKTAIARLTLPKVVGESGQTHLARQLIEFLMGETDGVPKDAKYLFRLYMARKQYKEAAKTAVIIAREEQAGGNYRNAHDVLFNMWQELVRHGIPVPYEMGQSLLVLHSYTLARLHVRRGDHLRGARMLLRVAASISRFPSHTVPILTSTVIECHRSGTSTNIVTTHVCRSGLKNSAFTYAAMLMRPEHRKEIDEKYRKKIEAIVRKPQRTEEPEKVSRCPYCPNEVPDSDLHCDQCKNNLPYCVATGYHIVPNDLTICPLCKFPAIKSEFVKLAEDGVVCPMCVETVAVSDIRVIAVGQLAKGQQEEQEAAEEQEEPRSLTGSSRASSSSIRM